MKNRVRFLWIMTAILVVTGSTGLLSACGGVVFKDAYRTTYVKNTVDKAAIYHQQGADYMSPMEPTAEQDVVMTLRTRRANVSKAYIEYSVDTGQSRIADMKFYRAEMKYAGPDETDYYEYWKGVIPAQKSPVRYHFVIVNERETVYLNQLNARAAAEDEAGEPANPFPSASGDFYYMPGFSTPEWSKGATWYSLLADSFFNGNPNNDKLTSGNNQQNVWGNKHYTGMSLSDGQPGHDYFGGDLAGVIANTDWLERLGVTALYMNPIHDANITAGYGSLDFLSVDSCYGTEETLKALTDKLHGLDIKIMMDCVVQYYNNAGKWYNDSGYYPLEGGMDDPDSEYYDLFLRDETGKVIYSPWGYPQIDFSQQGARELIYSETDSYMQYFVRNFGINAWRMDVGTNLSGSDPENWGTAPQILSDMRRYFKSMDEEFCFMTEGSTDEIVNGGSVDAFWNFDFFYAMKDFMEGNTTLKALEQELFDAVVTLPKSVADASYNFLSNHDFARETYRTGYDYKTMLASKLIQMTYVGSPVIYYGEEVGMDGRPNTGLSQGNEVGAWPTTFSSMDWDETGWDMRIYNFYAAMGELRKAFPDVYKTGVYQTVDVQEMNNIFAFLRASGSDRCMTVVNADDADKKGVVLDVRTLSLRDGTVLTDWLTGRKYIIRNGSVTLDVPVGGTVLVTGERTSSYCGSLEKSGDMEALSLGEGVFEIAGTGDVFDNADRFSMLSRTAYFNTTLRAESVSGGGSFALMMRADDSADAPYYAAVWKDGRLEIYARSAKGRKAVRKASVSLSEGEAFAISRLNDNQFICYRIREGTASPITGSESFVGLGPKFLAGLVPLSGRVRIKPVFTADSRQKATAFDTEADPMLSFGDESKAVISGGTLSMTGTDGPNFGKTYGYYRDFSIRTKLRYTPEPGGRAGLVVFQSEEQYVFAGLVLRDGNRVLTFGSMLNGNYAEYGSVRVSGDVTLQLEKTGCTYRAQYYDGENWLEFGSGLYMNFSRVYAGVMAEGASEAQFDYFCFGDSIEDGGSIGAQATYGEISFDLSADNDNRTLPLPQVVGGEWNDRFSGYTQSGIVDAFTAYQIKSAYTAFKAQFVLEPIYIAGNGRLGFTFGNSSLTARDGDGLMTDADGRLTLSLGGTIVMEHEIENFAPGGRYEFVVTATGNKLLVYLNERLIFGGDYVPKTGYLQIEGSYASYGVCSTYFGHYGRRWLTGMSMATIGPEGEDSFTFSSGTNGYVYGGLNVGVSEFVLAGNVQFSRLNRIKSAEFGINFSGTLGKTPEFGGMYVGFDHTKNFFIKKDAATVAEIRLEDLQLESFYWIVTVQKGVVRVYVDPYSADYGEALYSHEPILTYSDGEAHGGAVNVFGANASTTVVGLSLYGLRSEEDFTKVKGYTQRVIEEPIVSPDVMSGDAFENQGKDIISLPFDRRADLGAVKQYVSNWSVTQNGLSVTAVDEWGCATLAFGEFTNFELSYRIKTTTRGAFAGVQIAKRDPADDHNTSGVTLMNRPREEQNNLTVYGGGFGEAGLLADVERDADGYAVITVRCYYLNGRRVVTASSGGVQGEIVELDSFQNDTSGGYISFYAAGSTAAFKDVVIKKINADGTAI